MYTMKFFSIYVVVLFLDLSFSTQCRWVRYQLSQLNKECIRLMAEMGGPFPTRCLGENVKSMFPEGVYDLAGESKNDDIALVAYDALKETEKTFKNLTSTTWKNETLELFKNKLYRQVKNLKQCVGGEMTFSEDRSSSSVENGPLESFFEKLNELLVQKGDRSCALEIVRKEVRHSLVKLQEFLQNRRK